MKINQRTQAERSAATKDALVRAARPLFAAHGYGGVSTEAIVQAAGVTRGAMYHQFADKAELFAAVFEAVEIEVAGLIGAAVAAESATGGAPDPIEVMKLGARTWLDACAEPEVHRIVLLEAPAVLGWERWRVIGLQHGMGLVQALITHAISVGVIAEQPVAPLAHVLIGALDEAALYIARAADPVRARREIGAVIDRLVDVVAAR